MKKIIFISAFIFAMSSWSWSSVSFTLQAKNYTAHYKLFPFIPGGKLLGTVDATTQMNGQNKGNFALHNGLLSIFFNGSDGIGSEGGCADENIIITMDDAGLELLNAGIINTPLPVKWEADFLGEDYELQNGTIILTGRED